MKSLVLSMNTIHTKRFCNRLCIGAVALLSVACNNQNEQFPPGANVTIAPSAYSWTVIEYLDDQGQCIYFSDDYQDNVMVITVADASGRPIGEMDLEIYLSPSNSTSPPQQENLHIFHLYDDLNNNGVIDHPQELVSGTGDPILYATKTEKYHGTKTVIVRTNTSCGGYRATLHAYAGDGYDAMEIKTQTEEEPADETTESQDEVQVTE